MQSVASHMRTNSKDHASNSNYKPPTHQRDHSAMQLDKDYEELASPEYVGEVPVQRPSHGVPFSTGQEEQRRQAKITGGLYAINEGSLGDAHNSSSATDKLKLMQNPSSAAVGGVFAMEEMLSKGRRASQGIDECLMDDSRDNSPFESANQRIEESAMTDTMNLDAIALAANQGSQLANKRPFSPPIKL